MRIFAKFLITKVIRLVVLVIAKLEIAGEKNIPAQGKFILAVNHLGILDGPVGIVILDKLRMKNPIVIIAEKYQKFAIYRWIVDKLGYLFIDRFNPDFKTIREIVRRLAQGHFLVIAPEGTRSPNGSLIEGRPGTVYLAAKTQTSIIPVSVTGTEDKLLRPILGSFKRLNIKVTFGKPYSVPPLPRNNRDDFLHHQTELLMCQIAALLPLPYRGVYKNHPLLKNIGTD